VGLEVTDVTCAEARAIVERLRGRHADLTGESITLDGAPVGFGQAALIAPVAAAGASPLAVAVITSVVGAVAGWTVEEIAQSVRGRRRR